MELCVRIAFWIVTLSGCLQAKSLFKRSINQSTRKTFNLMRDEVKCLPDSKFYAPENVKDSCITTALNCVELELGGTVKLECNDPKNRIDQARETLYMLMQTLNSTENGHALTNSSECDCENWTQTPFSKFVDQTIALVEHQNVITLRVKVASA